MKQKYSSANTSINKLGKLYKHVVKNYVPCEVLDFGSGKYYIGSDYMTSKGFTVTSYEPSLGHTLDKSKQYDMIVLSNVINTIAEDEIIEDIIQTCKQMLKADGIILLTTYEGDKTGIGKESKEDCYQRNEKTKSYEKFGLKAKNKILKA